MPVDVSDLLKVHGLRKTPARAAVLEEFGKVNHALSHQDLEVSLGLGLDRVTLYRTLHSFEEKGLLHKIMDDKGVAQYALCESQCSEHHHADEHVHLYCVKCEKTYCLHDTVLPKMNFQPGIAVNSYRVLAEGFCQTCLSE